MKHSQLTDAAQAESEAFTKRERFAHYEDITNAVIREYVRIKSLHPVIAQSFDPNPVTASQKLTLDLIGYKIDIEKATEYALKDRLDLQVTWFSLALDKPVSPELREEVIWKCGRIYGARNLAPWRYWRRGSDCAVTTR
ncbi:hypothetical protein [Terriglobus sp. TAA 43]|uniref:hypothetical protein n=1 Tax=Terriglobus sp. TAA 43 TaxID=278961 RepID=UPI0006491A6A|nr:hypothetical protein [Terriglobus sp. TAA 43]